MADMSAMCLLIKRSIEFADWAAGEGLCPAGYGDPEAEAKNPDEFLLAYSQATGDEEWPTLAGRITSAFKEATDSATRAEAMCSDLAKAAYLAGFKASGEGWNGELVPEPETDKLWTLHRDLNLAALRNKEGAHE